MAVPTIPATKYSAQEVLNSVFDETTNSLNTAGGGGGSSTQYAEGAVSVTSTGTLSMYKNGTTLTAASMAAPFPVNIVSGSSSGVQYADGAARGTATGTACMVDDGTLMQSMKGDSSGRPLVTIDTALPAGTALIGKVGIDQTTPGSTNKVSIGTDGTVGVTGSVSVTGSFYQATQPVSIAATVAVSGPLTDTQLRATAVPVAASQTGTWTVQPGNTANTTAWKVDGSAVTQPVSGTFFQATQPVSIASTVVVDTELPSAAALADATANPTTTSVGAELMTFNGTTWDRARSAATTPSATLTGTLNTMPWAKYDATPTARTTGQSGPLQANIAGALNVNSYTLIAGEDQTNNVMQVTQKPLAVATYSPARYVNIATAASANVKASTGNVFSCSATNPSTAATSWLQLFNSTTAPAAAAVPVYSFPISTSTVAQSSMTLIGNDFFTNAGTNFSTGISFGLSSTATTYTAVVTTFGIVSVQYV